MDSCLYGFIQNGSLIRSTDGGGWQSDMQGTWHRHPTSNTLQVRGQLHVHTDMKQFMCQNVALVLLWNRALVMKGFSVKVVEIIIIVKVIKIIKNKVQYNGKGSDVKLNILSRGWRLACQCYFPVRVRWIGFNSTTRTEAIREWTKLYIKVELSVEVERLISTEEWPNTDTP